MAKKIKKKQIKRELEYFGEVIQNLEISLEMFHLRK